MTVKLNVRLAIELANAGLRRSPVEFCLPLVAVGVGTSVAEVVVHRVLGQGAALWIGLLPVLGCVVANYVAELLVATMYLDLSSAGGPSLGRAWRAVRYKGAGRVMWGLFVRYLGWGVVIGLATIVMSAVIIAATAVVRVAGSEVSGVAAVAGGASHTVLWAVLFPLLFALVYSRYLFVIPVVAIAGESGGQELIHDSELRTRLVRGTAILLAFAESLPTMVIYVTQRLAFGGLDAYHGSRVGAGVVGSLIAGCCMTWFVLVRTGLAVQLLEQVPLVSRLPGYAPWGGLDQGTNRA